MRNPFSTHSWIAVNLSLALVVSVCECTILNMDMSVTKQNDLQTKNLILRSEVDAMDSCHIVLKMLQVIENKPFGLANRVATREPLACWNTLEVSINMAQHFVSSGISSRLVLISLSIIPDADDTLSLLAYNRKRVFKKRLLLWQRRLHDFL